MAHAVRTSTLDRLAPAESEAVRRLVADAAVVDGASALNEAALLALDHAGDVRHVLAPPAGDAGAEAPLRGYAQLAPGDGRAPASWSSTRTPAATTSAPRCSGSCSRWPPARCRCGRWGTPRPRRRSPPGSACGPPGSCWS